MWEVYNIKADETVVIELSISRDSAAKCALKFLGLWRPSMCDRCFVSVPFVGSPSPEVTSAESSRPEPRKDSEQPVKTSPVPDGTIQATYQALRDHLLALGNDVQEKTPKGYVAFMRRYNFAIVRKQKSQIAIDLVRVEPSNIALKEGFSRRLNRSVARNRPCVGVTIRSHEDLRLAEPLLKQSYDAAS